MHTIKLWALCFTHLIILSGAENWVVESAGELAGESAQDYFGYSASFNAAGDVVATDAPYNHNVGLECMNGLLPIHTGIKKEQILMVRV